MDTYRAGEPEPQGAAYFDTLEPEPIEKNSAAGAAKNVAPSSKKINHKKHKEIVTFFR